MDPWASLSCTFRPESLKLLQRIKVAVGFR